MTFSTISQELFPAHSDHWPRMMAAVENFLNSLGMGEEVLFRLTVCLDELFTNTVKQSENRSDQKGMVRLTMRRHALDDAPAVLVTYEDDAPPFNPVEWLSHHRLGEDQAPQRVGGVGIQLLEGLTRQLHYEHDGQWNRISFAVAAKSEEP